MIAVSAVKLSVTSDVLLAAVGENVVSENVGSRVSLAEGGALESSVRPSVGMTVSVGAADAL